MAMLFLNSSVSSQDAATVNTNHWLAKLSTRSLSDNVSLSMTSSSINSSVHEFESEVLIPLYSIIFILSVVGNILVIVTLSQNRRMRTVTNIFLLNLVSKLSWLLLNWKFLLLKKIPKFICFLSHSIFAPK